MPALRGGDASSRLPGFGAAGRRCGLVAVDQGGEFGAITSAEFGTSPVEVALDGTDRHDQPVSDLAVGQPTGGQGDDLALPAGQRQRGGQRGQSRRAGAFAGLRQPVRRAAAASSRVRCVRVEPKRRAASRRRRRSARRQLRKGLSKGAAS
jgi:hypothetical protein